MKIPFTKSSGGEQSPASLFAALVLVALVPAVCVLWFMTVAMRNERLAVQERLTDVYLNHLTSLQRQVTSFWQSRQTALKSAEHASPAQIFATLVRANLADSVVIFDDSGKALYPSATVPGTPLEESGDWVLAKELEFQKKDFAAAAAAYSRIADLRPGAAVSTTSRARAMQSQASCLLNAGQKAQALKCLEVLASDPSLQQSTSAQGTLIVPNAQLLILKLGHDATNEPGSSRREEALTSKSEMQNPKTKTDQSLLTSAATIAGGNSRGTGPADFVLDLQRRTRDSLLQRLNDYGDPNFSSSQRRFLMEEVKGLGPSVAVFPTFKAEQLAAEYLEREPSRPTESKLQRAPLAKVWSLASADRAVVALFREERLKTELATLIDSFALPGVRVTVLPPGESFASSKPVAPQEASEFSPGWRLGLSFIGDDPLTTASARQTRFYLWTGSLMVLSIALVALLVARYVGAQIRLARLKNELVSTVSHELKTPLASMRALVDTLAAGRFRGQQQLQDYLQLISKENLRLSQLIENFLTFSRMERGKQRFQFEDLTPAAVVRAAVDALKEKLESPRCHFELCVGPDLPRIRGDSEALATVLINLLDNACKYTNGEKRIVARAYAKGRHVCFEVEDDGIGMTPAEARKIFDRFYQVDQSLTRQHGGCGLGLSIVKFIVVAHDGNVEVQSEPGKGSTFRVKIPVVGQSS